jgi:hypothetical protein
MSFFGQVLPTQSGVQGKMGKHLVAGTYNTIGADKGLGR